MGLVYGKKTDFGAGESRPETIILKPLRCDVEKLDASRNSLFQAASLLLT
jgi:hypothetical protein